MTVQGQITFFMGRKSCDAIHPMGCEYSSPSPSDAGDGLGLLWSRVFVTPQGNPCFVPRPSCGEDTHSEPTCSLLLVNVLHVNMLMCLYLKGQAAVWSSLSIRVHGRYDPPPPSLEWGPPNNSAEVTTEQATVH